MILVTGAGGTVGGELVNRLSSEGVPFRAAYRSAAGVAAARSRGIDAIGVEYDRPESLRPALQGVDSMFLLCANGPDQTRYEINAVREAVNGGVKRIVKLSVWDAGGQEFSFARTHRAVEREIESSGLVWTFLRPNGFMQNLSNFHAAGVKAGVIHLCGTRTPISHIDARDVAAVAAAVLATGSDHSAMAYDLTGPEALTYQQIAMSLSKALGREIVCEETSPADFRKAMIRSGSPDWVADAVIDLMRYYLDGRAGRVTPWVGRITGREPGSFDRFVRDYRGAFA
ncbi:MAG TPA: NAD(P)H-binding protein [Patescibacteria group bacterium]|nr:NAD(P)H-binding protein [Patescibacteria group bacterium]